ncbi:FKBP-type peptidyl-prolyl cis-trans isomerase [Arcanobacterium phocae]|uniref:FKBP-type peptidyl-prolyl cis-trans isomerase n=1 Tax=Arcanobacterium phocae TaxID=131112 RepID=UPI001C0E9619
MKRSIIALCAAVLLGLTGCSDSAANSASKTEQQAAGTEMPTVKIDGKDTHLEFPDSNPPEGLQKTVLDEGEGRVIEETDFVVAHYVGQVWGNEKPFDSSFSRGSGAGFSLQGVIPGWTQGLSGLKSGAKVILSIPSELGYGPAGGNAQAGIGKDDTIAFYVEILDAFGGDQAGDPNATPEADPASLPVEIEGELGQPVTVKVKEGTANPTEISTTVIARGSGPEVGGEGSRLYMQYSMSLIDNSKSETSYGKAGPFLSTIGGGSIFDGLTGIPVGSRVLVMAPPQGPESDDNKQGLAVVVDILGIDK